jgi:hypothetical protein
MKKKKRKKKKRKKQNIQIKNQHGIEDSGLV